jgi:hypothetical protein
LLFENSRLVLFCFCFCFFQKVVCLFFLHWFSPFLVFLNSLGVGLRHFTTLTDSQKGRRSSAGEYARPHSGVLGTDFWSSRLKSCHTPTGLGCPGWQVSIRETLKDPMHLAILSVKLHSETFQLDLKAGTTPRWNKLDYEWKRTIPNSELDFGTFT